MNNRFRQQMRALLMVSHGCVLGTLRDDETQVTEAVIVLRSEVEQLKKLYGDRLIIWEV